MIIKKATVSDLDLIVPLFDDYRIFYGQRSNRIAVHDFLEARFANGESVIFLAFKNVEAIGFTQLYKTFSSVSLQPFYILNDLYVMPTFRKQGVGEALLNQAKTHCQELGYKGLALETAVDNPAQDLYERLQWKKDTDYIHYFWTQSKP